MAYWYLTAPALSGQAHSLPVFRLDRQNQAVPRWSASKPGMAPVKGYRRAVARQEPGLIFRTLPRALKQAHECHQFAIGE